MGRRKSDREKMVTSVYVDKSLKELTTKYKLHDSDLWEIGARKQLELIGTEDILSKLMKLYQQDVTDAQDKLESLVTKLKKGCVFRVRDRGDRDDDTGYVINPEEFDNNKHVRIK